MKNDEDLFDQWVDELKTSGKSFNTIKAYRQDVQQFLQWLQKSDLNLKEINKDQIDQWRSLTVEENGATTAKRKVAAVTVFLKYCNNGFGMSVPVPKCVTARAVEKYESLDEKSEKLLHKVIKLHVFDDKKFAQTYLAVRFMLDYGMSMQQMLQLTYEEALAIPGLNETDFAVLKELQECAIGESLFQSRTGEPVSEQVVQRSLKDCLSVHGFHITPRVLRNTYINRIMQTESCRAVVKSTGLTFPSIGARIKPRE